MAVPVGLAGGEASARKVGTKPPPVDINVPDPDLKTKPSNPLTSAHHHHHYTSLLDSVCPICALLGLTFPL